MSVELARRMLFWCTVINCGLLLCWFLLVTFVHDWLYRQTSRWSRVSVEQFDVVNYAGIIIYKLGLILFNLVPCVVLYVLG